MVQRLFVNYYIYVRAVSLTLWSICVSSLIGVVYLGIIFNALVIGVYCCGIRIFECIVIFTNTKYYLLIY